MLPTPDRLLALVDRFAGREVLLLVDPVADRFIHGAPKRISREAPVLILRWEREQIEPGGGANSAANIRALGGTPLPVGCVGDDEAGERMIAALAARGVDVTGILRRSGWPTPTKTRILAGFPTGIKQQVVRFDREEFQPLDAAESAELGRRLAAFAGRADVAVLSDYGYGSVVPGLVPAVRAALRPDGRVLVDSRFRLQEFRGADGATPNEEEAEAMWGGALDDGPELDRAGDALRRRLDAAFLLVTRGSRGMALFAPEAAVHVPVHGSAQVADVTGAGDTVISTLALALAAGGSPLEAALLANYAGGLVVMKVGTATIAADELRAAIVADPTPLERTRWAAY
jgi:rfaE bifunctional protein kinase chain/domain